MAGFLISKPRLSVYGKLPGGCWLAGGPWIVWMAWLTVPYQNNSLISNPGNYHLIWWDGLVTRGNENSTIGLNPAKIQTEKIDGNTLVITYEK
jgi:hypothetical protein